MFFNVFKTRVDCFDVYNFYTASLNRSGLFLKTVFTYLFSVKVFAFADLCRSIAP